MNTNPACPVEKPYTDGKKIGIVSSPKYITIQNTETHAENPIRIGSPSILNGREILDKIAALSRLDSI